MSKKKAPKFNAAAAYAAAPDDDSMGQDSGGPAQDPNAPPADGSGASASGQDVTIPAQVVAQLEQLKQSGDFQSLGQMVAQLLP